MPRKHVRALGSRSYQDYYKKEELNFKQHVLAMSEFGFPFDTYDLRMTVKLYLDKKGCQARQFNNNFPGKDWCQGFLNRHKDLTQRFVCNIKKKHAAISESTIEKYMANLSNELQGVLPDNIINFDETNVTDDPGNKKILTKREVKYPKRVLNSSKASISLVYCGSAAGALLPPYVVYKVENMWDFWCIGGPKGTRYNHTKSGWFDGKCFQDWFFKIALPHLKKLNGKKMMIGDNLSSHINEKVLKSCSQHNLSFICVPPNSTILRSTYMLHSSDL